MMVDKVLPALLEPKDDRPPELVSVALRALECILDPATGLRDRLRDNGAACDQVRSGGRRQAHRFAASTAGGTGA